ncbi:ThiF family adenylyltransferase [Crossiella sp. CA198]|uniref:ThiF family adenylyltransferase n=1 Tax=Crossiella sp. CA198 TaxID=3455607 RepID=UPI003F8D0A90
MQRPRIKFEHQPVRYGVDRVRFGGNIPSIAGDVRDPDGWVWALAGTLDGTRTVDQVVADLVHRFPGKTRGDVLEDLDCLRQDGRLEDAAEPDPVELSAAERERYGRGQAYFRWVDRLPRSTSWAAQKLLRQAHVTVAGTGGAGGIAALALAVSGVGHVHCLDPDRVELSNLNRQILFTEADLGRPKVEVTVERLRAHNSTIEITGERTTIDGPAVLRRLAIGCHVLLVTADDPPEIRSWANRACQETGTAWVHAGYHGPQVNIGLYRPGPGPCYDCALAAQRQRRAEQPPVTLWPGADLATPVQAANISSAGTAGLMAAHAVMSLITGAPALPTNCEIGVNLATLRESSTVGPAEPRWDCPTCGPAGV